MDRLLRVDGTAVVRQRTDDRYYLRVQFVFLAQSILFAALAIWIFDWPYPYGLGYFLGTLTGICFWHSAVIERISRRARDMNIRFHIQRVVGAA